MCHNNSPNGDSHQDFNVTWSDGDTHDLAACKFGDNIGIGLA